MGDTPKNTYMGLIKRFLRGEISGAELQTRYLNRFQGESRPMSEDMFRLLDTIFAEIEAFEADEELLEGLRKEEPRPGWYFGEDQLRERLQERAKQLNKLKR